MLGMKRSDQSGGPHRGNNRTVLTRVPKMCPKWARQAVNNGQVTITTFLTCNEGAAPLAPFGASFKLVMRVGLRGGMAHLKHCLCDREATSAVSVIEPAWDERRPARLQVVESEPLSGVGGRMVSKMERPGNPAEQGP